MRFKTSITSGANLRNGSFRCSFLALHLVCGNMLQWLAAGSLHRAFQLLRVLLDEQRAECCHTEMISMLPFSICVPSVTFWNRSNYNNNSLEHLMS
jgi:hypothetical protein